jgi:hypothetical protein
MTLRLSYTPIFFSASAAMGTVELTGLEMMFRMACGSSSSRDRDAKQDQQQQHRRQGDALQHQALLQPNICIG